MAATPGNTPVPHVCQSFTMTANRNGAGADGLASFKTNRIIDIAGPEKPPAMNHPCAR